MNLIMWAGVSKKGEVASGADEGEGKILGTGTGIGWM